MHYSQTHPVRIGQTVCVFWVETGQRAKPMGTTLSGPKNVVYYLFWIFFVLFSFSISLRWLGWHTYTLNLSPKFLVPSFHDFRRFMTKFQLILIQCNFFPFFSFVLLLFLYGNMHRTYSTQVITIVRMSDHNPLLHPQVCQTLYVFFLIRVLGLLLHCFPSWTSIHIKFRDNWWKTWRSYENSSAGPSFKVEN